MPESQQAIFQDPQADRSLCYTWWRSMFRFVTAPFRILKRIEASATCSTSWLCDTQYRLSGSSSGSKPLLPMTDRVIRIQQLFFQDPQADRSLCYKEEINGMREDVQNFQDPQADRSLCYVTGQRVWPAHIWFFQDPQADRSLCYNDQRGCARDRDPRFQDPQADRSLCYNGYLIQFDRRWFGFQDPQADRSLCYRVRRERGGWRDFSSFAGEALFLASQRVEIREVPSESIPQKRQKVSCSENRLLSKKPGDFRTGMYDFLYFIRTIRAHF